MTADEIIVGTDDSPSARAALRGATAYTRSPGTALRAIHAVDGPEEQELYACPAIADYAYPHGSGWSVGVRQ